MPVTIIRQPQAATEYRKPLEQWRQYVIASDPEEVAGGLRATTFSSGGDTHELIYMGSEGQPNLLISPGSGGHAYVFAELAHFIYQRGYNVFVMPKQGGCTIPQLVERHLDAVRAIRIRFGDKIGAFGEGLGGFVVFYLGLAGAPIQSIACQNSPAILDEPAFREAVTHGGPQAALRRALIPGLILLAKVAPKIPVPIRLYLDFRKMVDSKEENRRIEAPLIESYGRDPDFDRSYPLAAALSLLTTPPPRPLSEMTIPTMFVVALRGFAPAYTRDLFARLPQKKKLIEVDGSVFWVVSHAKEEASLLCDWFDTTLPLAERSPSR